MRVALLLLPRKAPAPQRCEPELGEQRHRGGACIANGVHQKLGADEQEQAEFGHAAGMKLFIVKKPSSQLGVGHPTPPPSSPHLLPLGPQQLPLSAPPLLGSQRT